MNWNDYIKQRRKHRKEHQEYRELRNKLKSDDFELV